MPGVPRRALLKIGNGSLLAKGIKEDFEVVTLTVIPHAVMLRILDNLINSYSIFRRMNSMKWAIILSVSIILVGFCVTIPFARAEIVGAWTFDDVEGELNAEAVGTSQDISGNGLTGNIVGRVKLRKGWRGQGLEFLETDGAPGSQWPGWFEVPHHESLNLTNFTLAAWLKIPKLVDHPLIDGFCNNPCGNEQDWLINQAILGKTSGFSRTNYAMWISDAGDNERIDERGHVTTGFTAPEPKLTRVQILETSEKAAILGNKWQHVVATYGEPTLRIYVNGKLVGERENEAVKNANTDEKLIPKPGFAKNRGKEAPFMVGCQIVGRSVAGQRPSYGVAGIVDDVAVFNHALSEDEIRVLSRQGAAQFLAVESRGKLAVTWGRLKAGK